MKLEELEDVNFASCICSCAKVAHCNVDRIDVIFTDRNVPSEGQKKVGLVPLAHQKICSTF